MAADDVISIRGQVLEHTYIPTGIEREFVKFGISATGKVKLLGLLEKDWCPFILVDRLPSLFHIEGITLGAGEEVDEVAGGAGGMDADGIGEIGDRASEGQAAGVYGAGFTAGSLASIGLRRTGNKVGR